MMLKNDPSKSIHTIFFKMKRQLTTLIALVLFGATSFAQKLPATNILHFDFKQVNDSLYEFNNPKFLSGFNKTGYNNQPYFMTDDELYLTVQLARDTTQTDIYALDLKKRSLTQVTATVESEYSPTFIPPKGNQSSGYEFSCVRVEVDGNQRLWRFPISRSNNGEAALRTVTEIGYHYWIDSRDLVLFIVGNPHKMVVADARDESTRFIASDIGRCFRELPNGDIAFVQKVEEGNWLLKKLMIRNYRTELITATLSNSEDFTILRDGTIVMAQGTKLFKFNQAIDTSWIEIADFGYYGMKGISRLTVNGAENRIVMVVE